MDFNTHRSHFISSTRKGIHCWDLARTFFILAKKSEEIFDYKKSFALFTQAEKLCHEIPEFWIDYGKVFYHFSELQGSSTYAKEAMVYFNKAMLLSEGETKELAWEWFAKGASLVFYLNGGDEAFKKADIAFQEAILAAPTRANLWLLWAELHYRYGLLNSDIPHLEDALEKLSSSKISQCHSVSVVTLLSEILAFLGFLLDKYPLLQEGLTQIDRASDEVPKDAKVARSFGYVLLSCGHYFDDVRYFARSVNQFKQTLESSTFDSIAWEGIYLAYLAWGEKEKNPYFIQKAIGAILRVIELRKESPHYLKEAGFAYLKLRKIYEQKGIPREKEALHRAIHYLQSAISLFQGERVPIEWVFYLGEAYDFMGYLTKDEHLLRKGVNILENVTIYTPDFSKGLAAHALALSHLGELTENIDTLYHSLALFEAVLAKDHEDDAMWSSTGYTRFVLAKLVADPQHPEKREEHLAFAERDLAKGAQLGNGRANYYLACLYSLSGHLESSIDHLYRAGRRGALPSMERLMEDRWLEKVRQTSLFEDFLADLGER
ncbi:MAG: hypothetical protein KDK55_03745 [Chlamydiia bacterium]|nr:hypothetical protein [Chlamydiia bacterium]